MRTCPDCPPLPSPQPAFFCCFVRCRAWGSWPALSRSYDETVKGKRPGSYVSDRWGIGWGSRVSVLSLSLSAVTLPGGRRQLGMGGGGEETPREGGGGLLGLSRLRDVHCPGGWVWAGAATPPRSSRPAGAQAVPLWPHTGRGPRKGGPTTSLPYPRPLSLVLQPGAHVTLLLCRSEPTRAPLSPRPLS